MWILLLQAKFDLKIAIKFVQHVFSIKPNVGVGIKSLFFILFLLNLSNF